MPLLRSATGRVFFAFGDRAVMDAEAQRALETDRANAPVDLDALRRAVCAAGGAQVDGTLIPGLRAAAAPVFDLQGRLIDLTLFQRPLRSILQDAVSTVIDRHTVSLSFDVEEPDLTFDQMSNICSATRVMAGQRQPDGRSQRGTTMA